MKFCFHIFLLTFLLLGCEDGRTKRVYTETVPDAVPEQLVQAEPQRPAMDFEQIKDIPLPDTPLAWQTPEGWSEEKGSGIRIVTFRSTGQDPVEVSIISLSGRAGGLAPNAARWASQINISSDNIEQFINEQEEVTTDSGMTGRIIDFTGLQKDAPGSAPSTIGAVFPAGNDSLFVKMTGSKDAVTSAKDKFLQLLKSLKTR